MKKLGIRLLILVLGALILSPAVAALGLDPVPGDISFRLANAQIAVPVTYSLCASLGLTLLYKFLKG